MQELHRIYEVTRGGHRIEVERESEHKYRILYYEYSMRRREWTLVTWFAATSEYQAVNLADQYFRPRAYMQPA